MTFQQEVPRVVERQISGGRGAPLALRLAQAEVAQAAGARGAQQSFSPRASASRSSLDGPCCYPADASRSPSTAPRPPPLDRLSAVARERLPSLRAGAARIREAEGANDVADREAWPRPSLGLQYRREGSPTSEARTTS